MRAPDRLSRPQISLVGEVNDNMCAILMDSLAAPDGEGDVVIEITTPGGDAETARRMVLEIDLARERLGRRIVFLGKTIVYSAGTTIMGAFPKEDRFVTAEARLMIHCRQLEKDLSLSGPIRASIPKVEALLAQLQVGVDLEVEHFARLIEGSAISMDDLQKKALHNWYLTPQEALDLGLIGGIV